jgi:hypothetical protein
MLKQLNCFVAWKYRSIFVYNFKTIYIMSNCRADLGLGHQIVNLQDRQEVWGFFEDILMADGDLRDNGPDYWSEGETGTRHPDEDRNLRLCEELGYDSELDMIIGNAIKGKSVKTVKSFTKVFQEVFAGLSDQEFFGDCEYDIIELSAGTVCVAYATGGYNKW